MSHNSLIRFYKGQREVLHSLLRAEIPFTCTEVSSTSGAAAVSENTREFLAD